MGIYTVLMVGPDVPADQQGVIQNPDGTEVEIARGVDGRHIRSITMEANNEDHAKKIAVQQSEDIARQEFLADQAPGEEVDELAAADFVERNAFQVHSVESAAKSKKSSSE